MWFRNLKQKPKIMDARTEELHELMHTYRLKAEDVATILKREINTVRIWRCKSDNRNIPADALRLLKLEAPAYAASKQAAKARA